MKRFKMFNFAKKESENPYSTRFTYINNIDFIRKRKVHEYKVWYSGDSDELLNFYTNQITYEYDKDPIYNRNAKEYFWSIASSEAGFKRVHSGVPHAITSTICNIINYPSIKGHDEDIELQEILKENDFKNLMNQKQLPLTLVCGEGAIKINIDKSVSKYPLLEFYDAEKVRFKRKSGKIVEITYIDYYEIEDKQFILEESRGVTEEGSYIRYKAIKNERGVEEEVSVKELGLDLKDMFFAGYYRILGVESIMLYDPLNPDHGASIYAGKIDCFDELDLILSQASQTVKVSTPVEYYNPEILARSPTTGEAGMPHVFNRQYVRKYDAPDGDGNVNDDIITTQPKINSSEYGERYNDVLKVVLSGLLSPATLGIDVSLRDNAKAQREKEKATIFTRNNIIASEERFIKKVCEIVLDVQNFMVRGVLVELPHEITVNFEKFANPTFEEEISILGNAFSQGQISPERYVITLWGDSLSDDDKAKEIEYLKKIQEQDNLDLSAFESGDNAYNEARTNKDIPRERDPIEEADKAKDKIYHENI